MAPHPGTEAEYLREKARRDLLSLLEGVRGKKNLVVSKDLAGPVGLFVKFSVLQEYGVDRVFLLENRNVDSSQRNVIFLIHAEKPNHVQSAADQIKRLQKNESNIEHEFSVFWVPRRTLVSNQILEEEGVIGDVSVAEFPLSFNEILRLQFNKDHNPQPIYLSAKALMQIQLRHGYFPRIVGKGDKARKVVDQLLRMRRELDAEGSLGGSGGKLMASNTIENLIIIDRDVDFATVLMTQLTYEGLVDELFGINHNHTEVDTSIIGYAAPQASSNSSNTSKQSLKRKVQVDSSDQLFSQLRDANFAIVGGILNKVARRLESDYDSRHGAKSTSELREFVNKLPAYQAEHSSLKIHTNLAEEIMRRTRSDIFRQTLGVQQNIAAGADSTSQYDTIEELIARDAPITTILRLLCLDSCINGGLRPRDLDNFKKQVLQGYGYQHLLTLSNLEKMELLQPKVPSTGILLQGGSISAAGAKTNYNSLRKSLRLIVDEVDEQSPNDISYVYSGYAPLSVRLVQCVLQKAYVQALVKGNHSPQAAAAAAGAASTTPGWLGFEDVVKNARGSSFNIVPKGDEKAARARQTLTGSGGAKTVFVFFLGGITFTEIAALRFIAQHEAGRRNIIICTTAILNGDRMVRAGMEQGNLQNVCDN
ncbi:vacuolar sorting protein [Trichophyton rubrum]|uniref:Vacuolar sorting protein n=1 Tax=Trichophyton rubrum TaxID=5551 RepID=A0A178F794_TRIRU|nr:vacuolar sorting protein [Trichophyton rubrum]